MSSTRRFCGSNRLQKRSKIFFGLLPLWEGLGGNQQNENPRPDFEKVLGALLDNPFCRVGQDHLIFCDLMDYHIVEQRAVHHHMGNSRKGKLTEECLLISLDSFGGEAQLLGGLYQAIGIGALFVRTCLVMEVDRPYCLEMVARQAAPQSVMSCCLMQ